VTHVAAQKSRQALRRLHRENPQAYLVATGCYAELSPEQLTGLPGVGQVVGNRAKDHLAEWVSGEFAFEGEVVAGPRARRRIRALVKIQDGCDNACAYCIIHKARGPQRSRPLQQILDDVKARLAGGHQEIVLTGVHVGAYGRDHGSDSGGTDLWALVKRILAETDVPRLRLSSIEPWDLPQKALRLWDDSRLCRHLHLPLQSGCDATLRRMARRYTIAEFADLVSAAKDAIPDLAVTTDVIVGFPGETGREFEESLSFVRGAGFARVHVFPYSLRAGTAAASMPGQVSPRVKSDRASQMRTVAAESGLAFRRRFIGRTMEVLWESWRGEQGARRWSGLTDNYLRVYVAASEDLANTRTPTRIVGEARGGLQGDIVVQENGG
jgi:threonylcarbamoyladenosine tRNA methylthiotransferase MtaB